MWKTMVSQTGPRVVRSNFARGQFYPGKGPKKAKGPNENFGASKCYLGRNFLNLAPKGPTWQPAQQHTACTVNASKIPVHCDAIIEWERSWKVRNPANLKALWRHRQSKHMPALIAGDSSSTSKRHHGSKMFALGSIAILMRFRKWVAVAGIRHFLES